MRVRLSPASRPREVAGLPLRPGVWTLVPEAIRPAVRALAAVLGPLLTVDDPPAVLPAPAAPAPAGDAPAPVESPRRRRSREG
jgi:hypothetical protein